MKPRNNRSPQGDSAERQPCNRHGNHQSHRPGVAQPKTAMASQMKKQLVAAPAAYRPQPAPRVLQAKSSPGQTPGRTPSAGQPPRGPVAPAVYRPQPTPKVLQTKSAQSVGAACAHCNRTTPENRQPLNRGLPHAAHQQAGRAANQVEAQRAQAKPKASNHPASFKPSGASVQRWASSNAASAARGNTIQRTAKVPASRPPGGPQGGVVQCLQDLTALEWAGVATTLAAEATNTATNVTTDLGKFYSGGGNHAEDNLIAALPGALPVGNYNLLIVINRSPCSAISGAVKANGQQPCMERLTDLQTNGLAGPRTFSLQVIYRHLYGHSNMERALNALGLRQGITAGIHFGHGEGYYDVGVTQIVSQLES
jgi:hypothetical protein